MSHFTVLVAVKAGEMLEDLLEPYNENTQVDPYWEDEDISWEREYYADPDKHEDPMPADATLAEAVGWLNANEDEGATYRIDPDDPEKVQRQTSYNPDSKWDYWRIGGRWAGRLRVKPGATGHREHMSWEWREASPDDLPADNMVDAAKKSAIDIEGMRQEAEDRARETWAKWQAIVDEHGLPKTFEQLEQQLGIDAKGATGETYAPVREAYFAQPAVKVAQKAELLGWWGQTIDSYTSHTEDSFVENARLGTPCGYAFLSSGTGWLEPGRMEWWGLSSDTPDSEVVYRREVAKVVDGLPDDTMLVIVDCHI